MPTWRELEQEEREREARYQASIGPVGRLIDNNLTFVLTLFIVVPICMGIGILIGVIMAW